MQITLRQEGQGYGEVQTTITAKVDGVEVYSGPVDTLNEPLPPLPPDETIGVPLFTWVPNLSTLSSSSNVQRVTTVVEIIVNTGTLLLTDNSASYQMYPNDPLAWNSIVNPQDHGTYIEYDPMSNVTIDGVPYQKVDVENYTGQWYYVLQAGQVYAGTLNYPIPASNS